MTRTRYIDLTNGSLCLDFSAGDHGAVVYMNRKHQGVVVARLPEHCRLDKNEVEHLWCFFFRKKKMTPLTISQTAAILNELSRQRMDSFGAMGSEGKL